MTDKPKQRVVFNISERDYSKRLYKASNQNYLTNEGIDIFERSRTETIEKARKINESLLSKS